MKLARAEAASGRGLRRVAINLAEVARNCCIELEAQAAAKSISLSLDLAETPQLIEGELTLVSEMIGNLIENAIIYTQEGGNVWVSVGNTDGRVVFAVEDNGPGIAETHWPQIFDRFFRPAPAVGEGCGLGLAIVREIAMAHGASVELEAGREGLGARFFVIF
jgi:two-component system sensor histidine kinase TctE